MYKTEAHIQLDDHARRKIGALIRTCWEWESKNYGDVDVLTSAQETAYDSLDAHSSHVLVHDSNKTLVGYGRVSLLLTTEDLQKAGSELQDADIDLPAAYISRLVVLPHVRSQGISKLIHQARLKIAAEHGATNVYGWAVGIRPLQSLVTLGFSAIQVRHGFQCGWYKTRRIATLVRREMKRQLDTCDTNPAPKNIRLNCG